MRLSTHQEKRANTCVVWRYCLISILAVFLFVNCKDKTEQDVQHDQSKPITATSFYPEIGGIGTKVIFTGENFGSDISDIELYFNEKKAVVVSASGNKIYALAPRLPGDECIITIKIKDQQVKYTDTFAYKKQFIVTTVAGMPGGGDFRDGTLISARLGGINCLGIDKEGNIFGSNKYGGQAYVVNEKNDLVNLLLSSGVFLGAPTIDDDQTVFLPSESGLRYYELSRESLWLPKLKLILPTNDPKLAGLALDWKEGLAFSEYDGYIYTYFHGGKLIRFKQHDRIAELVACSRDNTLDASVAESDGYPFFDPVNKHILYLVHSKFACIYTYNLKTKEHKLFAGSQGILGHQDGKLLDAEFNDPRQITIGNDGYFYLADTRNHCIRQITPDGYVNTVVGFPGRSGYRDGAPDEALFNRPTGVAIDSEGNIYVADMENNCIRKLTMQ